MMELEGSFETLQPIVLILQMRNLMIPYFIRLLMVTISKIAKFVSGSGETKTILQIHFVYGYILNLNIKQAYTFI